MVSRPLPHAVLAGQDVREGAEVHPVPSLWEACRVSETQTSVDSLFQRDLGTIETGIKTKFSVVVEAKIPWISLGWCSSHCPVLW